MAKKSSKKDKAVVAKKPSTALTMAYVAKMVDAKIKAFEADLVACKRIQPAPE